MKQSLIRVRFLSCFGAASAMSTVRVLAIVYVIQAGLGTLAGVAYAVWLVYW
jgi:hypothetical protein